MKKGYKHGPEAIAKIVAERRARSVGPFKGRKHSLKTRLQMGSSQSLRCSDENFVHHNKGRKYWGKGQNDYEFLMPRFTDDD